MRLLCLALLLAACDDAADPCTGARIDPFPAELAFGDFRSDDGDLPARRVVLLSNTCGAPLEILETCIIEDDHNGDPTDPAFELEPPDRTVIEAGVDGAIRVTYAPSSRNEDLDQDGELDQDEALLVIQSNATDHPTLVVPLCGRRIRNNQEPDRLPCAEPFPIPPGERLDALCEL